MNSLVSKHILEPIHERIGRSGIASPKIAVLVSGGVDSSVVVHLLHSAGYRPELYYIQIGMDQDGFEDCSWEDDLAIVQMLAHQYELPLSVVSLHDEYWDKVVQYTIDSVRQGLTPNPDVMCNKLIKFGVFNEKWGHQYDFIATGHYATTTYVGEHLYLSTAPDPVKDQTDFLAQIDFAQISKLLFPTGHLTKAEVRAIATEAKLPSAQRKDSQGICFLGKVNYNEFIKRALGTKPGRIIERETGKTIGTHQGYWFHTIGQRKGLGLSGGPWFVVKKDIKRNIILVSQGYDPADQYGQHVVMQSINFISLDPWSYLAGGQSVPATERTPIAVSFKVRHSPDFLTGTLHYEHTSGTYELRSDSPIQGIAPGQYATIYDATQRLCFGSGMIHKGF